MINSDESIQLENTASQACTRAGTFALLLSILLCLLTVYWHDRRNAEALARYIGTRLLLAIYVENLDKDEVWHEYVELHPEAVRMPLDSLAQARLQKTSDSSGAQGTPTKPPSATTPMPIPSGPAKSPRAPRPPTDLTVTMTSDYPLTGIASIVEYMRMLNDADSLTRAGSVNNFFSFSIAKWGQRRNTLIYGNLMAGRCSVARLEVPSRKASFAVPQLDDEALLKCLTLDNVRELAGLELPTMSNPTDLGTRIIREPELSPGSLPRDPLAASIVSEILLAFVLYYFGAFAREACSSDRFPASGTLFGAFSHSASQLSVFFLAIWMPALSCCAVSIASEKLLIALGIVPVLLATFSVQRTLEQKLFFHGFKPAMLLEKQYDQMLKKLGSRFHRNST